MTREQAREATVNTADIDYQVGVMQAFKAGRKIESRRRNSAHSEWDDDEVPLWNWVVAEYRIKPTEKLRPWTSDEVPLGAWMRSKRNPQDRMLIHWVCSECDREMWLDKNEHSTDGGKTWLPCGVMEESK